MRHTSRGIRSMHWLCLFEGYVKDAQKVNSFLVVDSGSAGGNVVCSQVAAIRSTIYTWQAKLTCSIARELRHSRLAYMERKSRHYVGANSCGSIQWNSTNAQTHSAANVLHRTRHTKQAQMGSRKYQQLVVRACEGVADGPNHKQLYAAGSVAAFQEASWHFCHRWQKFTVPLPIAALSTYKYAAAATQTSSLD